MNKHISIDVMNHERFEIVASSDRLAAIAQQWTQLWQDTDACIFQSHSWTMAWWKAVENRSVFKLRIGLIWKGDRLLAVLPLAITRRKGLRFLEWAAGAHSDYGDLLCASDCPDAALRKLWSAIFEEGGFDLASLGRLLPEAAARRIIAVHGDSHDVGWQQGHRQEISSRIGGSWESGAAWLASQTKKARQNYRRGIKILGESGTVQFRLLSPDEPLEPVLDRLAALKRKWLAKNERTSDLFTENSLLLKAFVDVLAQSGSLRVFVIELDGVVVAVSINFVQHDRMMAWVTTYDPDFARASTGMVLIFDYVQWSIDHGLDMVDLLCGGEAFKDRLANDIVPLHSFIGARTAKGSIALLLQGVRRKLKGHSSQEKPTESA
jgi:CelD/BcsL family acetyltransferase involved in cellulose biosynthesis